MRADESAPWRRGGLLFGRMFEDWTIETRVFAPGARVFCIASAGCTALALAARGHDVTAVDVNPAQIALVRERVAGGATRLGSVDRMLARGRRAFGLLGWAEGTVRAFLALDDPAEQCQYWIEHLDTRRWRALLGALLSPLTLHLLYPAPLAEAVPRSFASIVRGRLERGFA